MIANYQPVIAGDTANMTQEEFTKSRTGLGGSDQATLLGISPWSSLYELWLKCTGQKTPPKLDEWTLQRGHILEELVAALFKKKTGYELVNDTRIFTHPKYPYLRANLDRLYLRPVYNERGMKIGHARGILECKTVLPTSPAVNNYWKRGLVPPYYQVQVMFYMMIMNLDEAYIAASWGFGEEDFAYIPIKRDMQKENMLLQKNVYFWERYVIPKVCPPKEISKKAENAIRCIKYGQQPDEGLPKKILDKSFIPIFEKVEKLDGEIRTVKAKLEDLQEERNKSLIPVYDAMGNHTYGVLPCGDGKSYYSINYKPRKKSKIDLPRLMADYPELVRDYAKIPLSAFKSDYPVIAEEYMIIDTDAITSRPLTVTQKKADQDSRLSTGMMEAV